MASTSRSVPTGIGYVIFALLMTFYAGLAIEAGKHNSPLWNQADRQHEVIAARAKADAGLASETLNESEKEAFPAWMNILGLLANGKYAYGSDGLSEPMEFYATMTQAHKVILSLHMALGGICIVLGLVQFWPAVRVRYRKLHRISGLAYTILGVISVSMGALHLTYAGVENTFQGYVFYVGLWTIAGIFIISLLLGWGYLLRRDFARHMGWLAIAYSALLTAPVQRYDWMLLGPFFPGLSQGVVNSIVNVALFWQCLLLGYGLFFWNRSVANVRSNVTMAAPVSKSAQIAGAVLWVIVVLTTLQQMLPEAPGSLILTQPQLVPQRILAALELLYGQEWVGILFTSATVMAVGGALWCLLANKVTNSIWLTTYAAAAICGVVLCGIAFDLGAPSSEVPSGGSFFGMAGISLLTFVILAALAQWRGHARLQREWMFFILSFAVAPSLLWWGIEGLRLAECVPAFYAEKGHGFIIAANGALTFSTIGGFLAAMYGQETAARKLG